MENPLGDADEYERRLARGRSRRRLFLAGVGVALVGAGVWLWRRSGADDRSDDVSATVTVQRGAAVTVTTGELEHEVNPGSVQLALDEDLDRQLRAAIGQGLRAVAP